MVFKYNPHVVVLWCTGWTIITRKWPNPEKVIQRVLFSLYHQHLCWCQQPRVKFLEYEGSIPNSPNCLIQTQLHKCCNKGYIIPVRFQILNFQHGSLGVPLFGKGWRFKDRSHSQVLYLCAFPIWTKLAKMEHPWIQNTCTSVRFCIFWMNELVMGVWMVEYVWNTSFFQY